LVPQTSYKRPVFGRHFATSDAKSARRSIIKRAIQRTFAYSCVKIHGLDPAIRQGACMNKDLRVAKCILALAVLSAPICHAQIRPPVHEGQGAISIGPLHDKQRDQLIVVDLTVKKDGSVGNVDVVAGFYDEEYRAHAVVALGRLRFQPATSDGAPVDFYGWRLVLTTRSTFMTTTHPAFQSEYAKVGALTQAGNFAAAEAEIQDLIRHKITTVFEYAFLNEALVPLYIKLNRPYDALRASRNATLRSGHMETEYFAGSRIRANDPNWPYFLPKDLLVGALRQRFAVAAELERFGEANATYNELRSLDDLSDDDPITVRAKDLEARSRSPDPLLVHGKIEQGEWEFSPTRRLLSIQAAPGAIHTVDIRCLVHKENVPFDPSHDLMLPPPWGACVLVFAGDEGTDIQLKEMFLPRPGF
jgi:hypothetical protein